MSDRITVDRHLYLTKDRCRVVEEGDPEARWLLWAPGTEVRREDYERLTVKSRTPEANKARRPGKHK